MTEFNDLLSAQSEYSDDIVLPFQLEKISVHGRVVRLGVSIDKILRQHQYPEDVSLLLGEALALTALLGASLKFDGKLILQTKTDGPVDMIVAQFETSERSTGHLRGYARFDQDKLDQMVKAPHGQLLGHGHMVMTIDQGVDMQRYQGIVALEGNSLSEAADTYFRQSEQLPTLVKLAVTQQYIGGPHSQWHWRAGGLMIQDLTTEGGKPYHKESDEHKMLDLADDPVLDDNIFDDDGWNRAYHLAATLEDHEVLDPLLPPEHILYRLFHEEGIRVFPSKLLRAECSCSRDHVLNIMKTFSHDDLVSMIKKDADFIEVVCEFCSKKYEFKLAEVETVESK